MFKKQGKSELTGRPIEVKKVKEDKVRKEAEKKVVGDKAKVK